MASANRRGPWLPEEDQRLLQLVHTQGPNNWVRISQNMQHRSPKQCRERFHQNLKPTLNHEPISPQEGQLIEQMVTEIGKRWAEIARRLGNRSDNAVKNWWNGSMNRRRRNVLQHAHALKSVGSRLHPIPTVPLGGCATHHSDLSPKYGSPRRVVDQTGPCQSSHDGSLAEAVVSSILLASSQSQALLTMTSRYTIQVRVKRDLRMSIVISREPVVVLITSSLR